MISKAEGTNAANNTEKTGETTAAGAAAGTGTTTTAVKTEADIQKAAEDLLAKYPPAKATQDYDMYSGDNPELQALKQAIDGGAIEELSAQGFSRDNIIAIIEKTAEFLIKL